MRERPSTLVGLSVNAMWQDFNRVCDENGVGEHPDDWLPWWTVYYAGYEFRCAENQGALA